MTQEIEEVQAPELLGELEVAEAEMLYRQALDIVDEVLGHDHLYAAGLYLKLAELEHARGRTAEGEALARWGLAIRERHEFHE